MPQDAPPNAPREPFLAEVLDQPRALARLLDHYLNGDGEAAMARAATLCREAKRGPVFTGMGSSCYAPLVAAHVLTSKSAPAQVWEAGELFYYYLGGLSGEQVLVAVSQSGQTIEVRKIVSAVRDKMPVIAVTNNPDSWLGANCDVLLPMRAGTERMSSSKTYLNTLALLSILAWQSVDGLDAARRQELRRVPALVEHELSGWEGRMRPCLEFLGDPMFLHLIGRGPSYATALQGQVIIKEGAHILTEAHSGASFRHGPFEIINPRHRAVVFAARGRTDSITTNLVRDMTAAGSRVLLVTNHAPPEAIDGAFTYELPDVPETLFPMLDIVPVQMLLILLARRHGVEPGTITQGAKVTVKE